LKKRRREDIKVNFLSVEGCRLITESSCSFLAGQDGSYTWSKLKTEKQTILPGTSWNVGSKMKVSGLPCSNFQVLFTPTLAVFKGAPYPVEIPQPSRHTLSRGALSAT